MTEEKHECKTYAEMLAVLREAKEAGHTAWWNHDELMAGVHVDLAGKGFTADFRKAKGKDRIA